MPATASRRWRSSLDELLEVLLALGDLALLRGELVLALVDRLGAPVDRLLSLGEPLLERLDLLAALLDVGLGLLLHLEDLILGLDQCFLLHRLGLLRRVPDQALGLFGGARGTVLHEEAVECVAEGDADHCSDDGDHDCAACALPSSQSQAQ